MTSKERLIATLNHRQPDRVCVDFGGTWITGIHASMVHQLKQRLIGTSAPPVFIEAGFDILNPVQCSAAGMDAVELKKNFGKDITFWGGCVNTQHTMYSTPEAVYREVRERIDIFNQDGGFVCNAVHNVQGNSPVENVLAMFKAISDSSQS